MLLMRKMVKQFPKDETFGLSNQMTRAVVSITSNIAEGFGRQTHKEKNQFYSISFGSLTEIQNQLLIARDVKYISKEDFHIIAHQTVVVHKILSGLIKTTKYKSS